MRQTLVKNKNNVIRNNKFNVIGWNLQLIPKVLKEDFIKVH